MDNKLKYLIYSTPDEDVAVNAVIKDETILLTEKAMAELFNVGIPAISKHLKKFFEEGELEETTTEHGAIEGKTQTKPTRFYNLDAIISLGYRVNSRKATNFRIWATGILKEYMTKGFAMDDERLKQGKTAFFDYIKDLIERENRFTMIEFAVSINEFLTFRKYDVLEGKGKITIKTADKKAVAEYDEFNKTQKIDSDFDKQIKELIEKGGGK